MVVYGGERERVGVSGWWSVVVIMGPLTEIVSHSPNSNVNHVTRSLKNLMENLV